MFYIYRMPGNPTTHGHPSMQVPSLTELVWFIKFTCNPVCSVGVSHLWIQIHISPSVLRPLLLVKWLGWRSEEKGGVNIAATQTTENRRRGALFSRTIITSLQCQVFSSSSLLPSLLCFPPNPNSHSFPMSSLSSFLFTFYLKCLTKIKYSTKTGPSLWQPHWKGTYFSPSSMIMLIFSMSTNINWLPKR